MIRNDNYLESGMSSAAQRRIEAREARRKQAEEAQASQLAPGAQVILQWIEEEMNQVCDLRNMVLHVADQELARDELLARQLHLEFLEKLKARAMKVVRVADRRDKESKLTEAAMQKELSDHA